jgi:pimeloyl-ACP methyl ester carboxylesterase
VDIQRIEFVNRTGNRLAGYLDLPAPREAVAYGVLAHCFTCGKDLKPFVHMSRALAGEGIALLRFDFSGLGESGGDFSESTVVSNVDDVVDSGRYLQERFDGPKLLVGHSLGGVAVLGAARSLDSVRAVVTIGAPANPAGLGEKLSRAREEAERTGESSVTVGGRVFRLRKRFFDELTATDMKRVIPSIGKALLILHSPADNVVSVENAGEIFRAARHPKSFVSLDGADHLLLEQHDAVYAGKLIGVWARHYF